MIRQEIKELVDNIFTNNAGHVEKTGYEYFKNFFSNQSPYATVVKCADSRVQTSAFDNNKAAGALFVVRNIGNQIETAKGSIEYGVRRLNTPILLIVGHSNCEAIRAAANDFSHESLSIQKELSSLKLHTHDLNNAILENIHNQVKVALDMFQDLIEKGKLIVLGTVYDFRNDFKGGYGKLILINLNGEKNPDKIRASYYIKDCSNITIGAGG